MIILEQTLSLCLIGSFIVLCSFVSQIEAILLNNISKCCPAGKHLRGLECRTDAVWDARFPTWPNQRIFRPPCAEWDTVAVAIYETNRYRLLENGTFILASRTTNERTRELVLGKDEICADFSEDHFDQVAFLLCPCDRVLCLHKCCPVGHAEKNGGCDAVGEEWAPLAYSTPEDVAYELLGGVLPSCTRGKLANLVFQVEQRELLGDWWAYPHGYAFYDHQVCGDAGVDVDGARVEVLYFCVGEILLGDDVLSVALHFAASLVLAAAVLSRWVLPRSLLRSPSLSYSLSLLLAYLCVAFSTVTNRTAISSTCLIEDIFTQYFFLASAFWLNAVIIDSFIALRSLGSCGSTSDRTRRILLAYGWGMPFICVAFTAVLHFSPKANSNAQIITTKRSCWWESTSGFIALSAFYIGPKVVLAALGFIILIYSSFKVHKTHKHQYLLTRPVMNHFETVVVPKIRNTTIYAGLLMTVGLLETALEIAWVSLSWLENGLVLHFHLQVATAGLDFFRALLIAVFSSYLHYQRMELRDEKTKQQQPPLDDAPAL